MKQLKYELPRKKRIKPNKINQQDRKQELCSICLGGKVDYTGKKCFLCGGKGYIDYRKVYPPVSSYLTTKSKEDKMNQQDIEEVKKIARSMITASHYNNLPDASLDSYIREICQLFPQPLDKELLLAPEEIKAETKKASEMWVNPCNGYEQWDWDAFLLQWLLKAQLAKLPQPLDDKELREKIAEAYWLEYRNVCWSAFWDTSWTDLKLTEGSPANTYVTACYRFAEILALLQKVGMPEKEEVMDDKELRKEIEVEIVKYMMRKGAMIKLPKPLSKTILALLQQREEGWVSALKKYKVTVDSPESLATAVDILIEEARTEALRGMGKWLWSQTRWSAPDHPHVRYGYFPEEDFDNLIERGEMPNLKP